MEDSTGRERRGRRWKWPTVGVAAVAALAAGVLGTVTVAAHADDGRDNAGSTVVAGNHGPSRLTSDRREVRIHVDQHGFYLARLCIVVDPNNQVGIKTCSDTLADGGSTDFTVSNVSTDGGRVDFVVEEIGGEALDASSAAHSSVGYDGSDQDLDLCFKSTGSLFSPGAEEC